MAKKVEVTHKQVGRNLNVVIAGEVFTKTGNKTDLLPVKESLVAYTEKPTAKNLKALKDLLTPKSVAKEKEMIKAKAEVKRAKKAAPRGKKVELTLVQQLEEKIKSGDIKPEELESLKQAMGVEKKVQQSAPMATTGRRTGGEY